MSSRGKDIIGEIGVATNRFPNKKEFLDREMECCCGHRFTLGKKDFPLITKHRYKWTNLRELDCYEELHGYATFMTYGIEIFIRCPCPVCGHRITLKRITKKVGDVTIPYYDNERKKVFKKVKKILSKIK